MLRGCIAAVVLAVSATPAHAYEFWLRAQTIAQAYQLRAYPPSAPELFHGPRPYTPTLAARIWDGSAPAAAPPRARLPARGPRASAQGSLPGDHA